MTDKNHGLPPKPETRGRPATPAPNVTWVDRTGFKTTAKDITAAIERMAKLDPSSFYTVYVYAAAGPREPLEWAMTVTSVKGRYTLTITQNQPFGAIQFDSKVQ